MSYSYKDFSSYNVDNWFQIVNNVEFKDIFNKNYKICNEYKLIKLEYEDIKYFMKNKKFKNRIIKEINKFLSQNNEGYFFKLSSRSPKDILEKNSKYEIFDEDHRTIQTEKKIKQLEILKVYNSNDVMELLRKSKRTNEDMQLYLDYKDPREHLYLVFQEWKQCLGKGKEFRCFIKDYELIGVCLFKSEYYSTRTTIPITLIQKFINQMIKQIKKINMSKCVCDIFIPFDETRVYFIEFNPFDENVDTFSLDYDELNKTKTLLITL
jgi:hypothetical protein